MSKEKKDDFKCDCGSPEVFRCSCLEKGEDWEHIGECAKLLRQKADIMEKELSARKGKE